MRPLLVVCLLLLSGCGSTSPPPMPTALVLRATAIPSMGSFLTTAELPDFSLYGDGRVIRPVQPVGSLQVAEEVTPNPRLTRAAYEYAHNAELNQDVTYDNPDVIDGSVLVLTLVSGDQRHAVRAANPDHSDDRRLTELARLQEALDRWPGEGVPYRPTKVFAVGTPVDSTGPTAPWPFKPFSKDTKCLVLDGAAETAARAARPNTRWISDGIGYWVTFRPALPDEQTCADLAQY